MADPTCRTRTDAQYLIEALADGVQVLEALTEENYRPVRASEILSRLERQPEQYPDLRTEQKRLNDKRPRWSYDKVRRCLRTLKLLGYTVETEGYWRMSVKAGKFSSDFLAVLVRL